jgi:hypothetical protein
MKSSYLFSSLVPDDSCSNFQFLPRNRRNEYWISIHITQEKLLARFIPSPLAPSVWVQEFRLFAFLPVVTVAVTAVAGAVTPVVTIGLSLAAVAV